VKKPQYVVSSSGHGSRPEDIIASCEALQGHNLKQENAQKTIKEWEDSFREVELAEKTEGRSGVVGQDEKILEPVKAGKQAPQTRLTGRTYI
jgi:hypothetical protein